jgi:hypothetical protein
MEAPEGSQFIAVAWIRSEQYAVGFEYEAKSALLFDLGEYLQEMGSSNGGLASTQPHLNKTPADGHSQELLSSFQRCKKLTERIRPL